MTRASVRDIDWREFVARGFRSPCGQVNVWARERICGGISIMRMQGTAAEFSTQPDPREDRHITFAFVESGIVSVWDGHDPWTRIDASLFIAPNGITRTVRLEGRWQVVVATIPRSAIETFAPKLPSLIGTFDGLRLLEQSMHRFLAATVNTTATPSPIEAYAIEQLVMEMASAVLLDRLGSGWTNEEPRAVLRNRALAVIVQQCADADLTPARVAQEVQTSLRQLQLVFAEAESSVAGEIRRQRARLARSLLLDSRYDVLTVEQIARKSGFRTTMSLRRALDDEYEVSPRTLRATRGAQNDVVSTSSVTSSHKSRRKSAQRA